MSRQCRSPLATLARFLRWLADVIDKACGRVAEREGDQPHEGSVIYESERDKYRAECSCGWEMCEAWEASARSLLDQHLAEREGDQNPGGAGTTERGAGCCGVPPRANPDREGDQ